MIHNSLEDTKTRLSSVGLDVSVEIVDKTASSHDIWLVSFMEYDLGYFDLETRVLEPLENPMS